jgi:hypothetical protein
MTDQPSFMRDIPDTEEGKATAEVLSDAPATEETPATETTTETKPTESGKTEEPKTEVKPGDEPKTEEKKEEQPKTETPKTEEKKVEEKPKEPVTSAPTETKPTTTDAVKKVVEKLAPKTDAAQTTREKLLETVETLKKIPLISTEIPDPENYYNDDKTFNLAGYLKDYTKSFSIAIQGALLGGPLSATMFGLIHDALRQEDSERDAQVAVQRESQTILDKLQTAFPVLKTDEKLQTRFERTIYGEKVRREAQAKAEGKELQPMSYENYEELLSDLISMVPPASPPPPDNTEQPKGGPQLSSTTEQPPSVIEQDIAGMQAAKNKQLF